MVAISDPDHIDGLRQRQGFDFAPVTEGVALALDDQRRALECLEMYGAELFRRLGRMKRIAKANEASDLSAAIKFVGDQAGDASAQRLAADDDLSAACRVFFHGLDDAAIFGRQHFCFRRWSFWSTVAPGRHIRELEGRDGDTVCSDQFRQGFEERRGDTGASAVRED